MSDFVADAVKKYEAGLPVFKKLFNLKKEELIKTVKEIVGDDYSSILDNNPDVFKEIRNDEPEKISISFYDSIKITPFGINFVGEHGYNSKKLVEFNRFFTL